ncbi:Alpha-2,8-sialyltransferase 8B [Holothuria leucospilota]|uniref:Alpha-2,8-sialyltransferase 8B n=1 Tax=Holothuria leucospilota TaxID=206669 RepID=A0A9Q1HFL7_HOLLE|nr:Alpha-2,8-sialyltransferase 8B [Holothuria leucospilota]
MTTINYLILCCCLSLVTIFSLYLYTFYGYSPPIYGEYSEDIEVPVAYDVSKLCRKICNRKNNTCYDPNLVIIVYKKTTPNKMGFSQIFSPYVRIAGLKSLAEEKSDKYFKKRKFCKINEVDPDFYTIERQNKCAIVGSSGILLKSRCGKEIDSNDFVLRANLAKVKGYSDDVGKKTDLMMINDETLRNMYTTTVTPVNDTEGRRNLTRLIATIRTFGDSIFWFAKNTERHGYREKLRKIAELFIKESIKAKLGFTSHKACQAASERWKTKTNPSSGLILLTVAETFCDSISLYGFYPYAKSPTGEHILHHYYEPNLTEFETTVHNFDKEHKLLQSLHKKGKLKLHIEACA